MIAEIVAVLVDLNTQSAERGRFLGQGDGDD